VVVFELSSWRLSALGKIKKSPSIAVMTNILPDHLNYYKTMEGYVKDKKNIFLFQGAKNWLVANIDNEYIKNIAEEAKSRLMKISSVPQKEGHSIFIESDAIYLNDGNDAKKVIDLSEIRLRGAHNLANIMLAAGACFAYGISLPEIKKAIADFSGLAHRLEYVKTAKGIKYYNDSAATIPEAVISAVGSFSEPVILIAGGSDKNLDFRSLGELIAKKAKGVVFLKGSATEKLIAEVQKNLKEGEEKKDFSISDSMDKAVEIASQSAASGDVVLLSPGAASFGLFLNEFDRGEKFKQAVEKLK
jgi:UDP-N-acetylmuramoylalanine--D-glutamate ligase